MPKPVIVLVLLKGLLPTIAVVASLVVVEATNSGSLPILLWILTPGLTFVVAVSHAYMEKRVSITDVHRDLGENGVEGGGDDVREQIQITTSRGRTISTVITTYVDRDDSQNLTEGDNIMSQKLSGETAISTLVGKSIASDFVTYDIAFSATPMVSVQVGAGYGFVKVWTQDVTNSEFYIVLEKEDGFKGEKIPVKWMASETFSQ